MFSGLSIRSFEIVGYVDPAPAGLAEPDGSRASPPARPTRTPQELIACEKLRSPDGRLAQPLASRSYPPRARGWPEGLLRKADRRRRSRRAIELAAAAGKRHGHDRLMVGLVLRYSPLYRDLRTAQADGHARQDRVDRGVRAYRALSRRLLHARLAALRAAIPAASCWKNAATTSTSTMA